MYANFGCNAASNCKAVNNILLILYQTSKGIMKYAVIIETVRFIYGYECIGSYCSTEFPITE